MSDRHKKEFDDELIDEADGNRDREPDEDSLSKFHGAADDLDWGKEGDEEGEEVEDDEDDDQD